MSDKVKTTDEIQNQNDQNMLKFWQGTEIEYGTIGDTNPDYLCFINGVGIKIGNKVIIKNNKKIDTGETIDPSTLKFGDRIDNKATVVGTFDSSDLGTVVFAVLDSSYYKTDSWANGLLTIDVGLPLYDTEEDALNAKESSTYNTDYIINNYSDKEIESFTYVRSLDEITINNKKYKCQIPNCYELSQIYEKREELYNLDPTASENIALNDLRSWMFETGSKFDAWSSNMCFKGYAWAKYAYGSNLQENINQTACIIPIIEIPLK